MFEKIMHPIQIRTDIIDKINMICKRYQEICDNIKSVNFDRFSWESVAKEYYDLYVNLK